MAKLIALILAFSAFVALATAHTTIVTTTIEDENPISSQQQQCQRQLQGESFNQCRMYLQQGQGQSQSPYDDFRHQQGQQGPKQILDRCCEELENIEEECQCEAVKRVFRDVQQRVQQQHGQQGGSQQLQSQQLKQKAQRLPNQCNLPIRRRQCSIGTISTTMTTIDDSNDFPIPFRPKGSEQCSQSQIQRPVNQCRRYVEEQMFSSPRTLLMSISRQGQQDPELSQCCDELQNLNRDCQCEAIEELARRMIRQPQQQRGQRYQGGKQQQQMQAARRAIRNLPDRCKIDVQQCNVPY